MISITPPILVGPPDEVQVFATLEQLERYFELWILDQKPRPPSAYDAEGKLLKFVLDEARASPSGITLMPVEATGTHQREATEYLIRFLEDYQEDSSSLQSLSLSELFAKAIRFSVRA